MASLQVVSLTKYMQKKIIAKFVTGMGTLEK